MYIKQVVIDGFKSYAQRTEIVGFDPLFNAITGLNGSGKSNILDAICFLLGISNLSQVCAPSASTHVWLERVSEMRVGLQASSIGPTGTSKQPSGAGLQEWSSRHHQGNSDHHV